MPASSPKRKSPRRKNRKVLSPTQRLSREIQRLSREVKLSRKTRRSPSRAQPSVAKLSRRIENLSRSMKSVSPRRSPRRSVRRSPRRKLSPEQKLSREITKTINSMTRGSPASLLLGGGLGSLSGLGSLVKMNQDHKDALKITSLSPTLWPGFGIDAIGMTSSLGADVGDDTLTKIEWYSFIAGLSNAQMTVLLKQHGLLKTDIDREVNPYNRLRYFQTLLKCCKNLSPATSDGAE